MTKSAVSSSLRDYYTYQVPLVQLVYYHTSFVLGIATQYTAACKIHTKSSTHKKEHYYHTINTYYSSEGPSVVRVCARRFHPHYSGHPHYINKRLKSDSANSRTSAHTRTFRVLRIPKSAGIALFAIELG